MSHETFMKAIIENPCDDDTRLVYADWLEEQGGDANLARAEFIRLQMQLHRGTDTDEEEKTIPLSTGRRWAIEKRCKKLLADSNDAWAPEGLRDIVDKTRINIYTANEREIEYEFYRGFPEKLTISADIFTEHQQRIRSELPEITPVTGIKIPYMQSVDIPKVFSEDNMEFFSNLLSFGIVAAMYQMNEESNALWQSYLKELTNLQQLELEGTGITNKRLVHLKKLKNLQQLNLAWTKITDKGLVRLQKLTNLQQLNLKGIGITNKGLVYLKKLNNLQWLNLAWTKITDEGLEHLKELNNLQKLDLWNTGITDKGLGHLQKLTNLQHLNLGYTGITSKGLEHLKGLKSLQYLNLAWTNTTKARVLKCMRQGGLKNIGEVWIGQDEPIPFEEVAAAKEAGKTWVAKTGRGGAGPNPPSTEPPQGIVR